jgi:hypothetical protein
MPNWYNKIVLGTGGRSGTPIMENPDRQWYNPYLRPQVGDGQGDKLTTPGEVGGLGGSRFRGKLAPSGITATGDEEEKDSAQQDIPDTFHNLLKDPKQESEDEPQPSTNEGLNGRKLSDPEDPLSDEKLMENSLNERSSDGTGRQNGIPVSRKPNEIYRQVSLKQNFPTKLF